MLRRALAALLLAASGSLSARAGPVRAVALRAPPVRTAARPALAALPARGLRAAPPSLRGLPAVLAARTAPAAPPPRRRADSAWDAGSGAAEREELARRIWAVLSRLPGFRGHEAFGRQRGVGIVFVSFSGGGPGLDPENLAQFEPDQNRLLLNWDRVGPELPELERRLGSREGALSAAAAALAPVAVHELRHAMLRGEFGSDFPGLREEEILAHLDQGAAFDELLRLFPEFAEARTPLFEHARRAAELRRRGFGELARFVLRKYEQQPSLAAPAADNAAAARAALERALAEPERHTPGQLERARRAAAFWLDEGAVARLTALLQRHIDAAYRALAGS